MKISDLQFTDSFADRHIGPNTNEVEAMLRELGQSSMDAFIHSVVPSKIRIKKPLNLPAAKSEFMALKEIRAIAAKNEVYRSYIGMGYYGCITPPVIQRNILENPGWYTQYTPYQAEISQGRLEALLNFQTMITELTGLPIANASLLDEATAAAEALAMAWAIYKSKNPTAVDAAFFVSKYAHPQTIEVIQTRAEPLGIKIIVGDEKTFSFSEKIFATFVQYPNTNGNVEDLTSFAGKTHDSGAAFIVATDLLALCSLKSPGEMGADIVIGSSQRFGVPVGFGGPHAAFMSTKDEFKRLIPGRIIGLSQDAFGKPAARLALQTREQHIRREKATSNICTAQVLLAVISGLYAVYHGPQGLKKISERVHNLTKVFAAALKLAGHTLSNQHFYDTLTFKLNPSTLSHFNATLAAKKINLRPMGSNEFQIAFDETVSLSDLQDLCLCLFEVKDFSFDKILDATPEAHAFPSSVKRTGAYLTQTVFNRFHSETELLRYMRRLQEKDLSLTTSMIALGSCTMKLNATAEMFPITWPEFNSIHPFAPKNQTLGYRALFTQLEHWLSEITGFDGISLQPNAGSQGEYAGLLVIRKYHQSRGDHKRNICLIPRSAHGTNPASAVMAGMRVVVVECDANGNVDMADLKAKATQHKDDLSAAMITYPSTHGVFEESIVEFCDIIHANGGQVYMDGANMNAQVGLCRPGDFGPDVCHLNLHKTFCIPHGGGGPGMGPIGVKAHLKSFLPGHSVVSSNENADAVSAVSAAPWGSASILPISWMYIAMMGPDGLKRATELAILNANYMAKRLDASYPVLYKGASGFVAHECIIDLRRIKDITGVDVEDVAKRLMDYGFHAPTVSFPVPGTMMIEPTESESLAELNKFCEAMLLIRKEISEIESGKADKQDNVLKNAPHTSDQIIQTEWKRSYAREKAAFPAPWSKHSKFWPSVSRVNGVLGDRNLICTCAPIDQY